MKKVLFATTALIATAGVASADIALTGGANMGYKDDGTVAGSHAEIDFNIVASGVSDNGISFGASLDIDGDTTRATSGNTFGENASDTEVYISGDFGTITIGDVGHATDLDITEAGFDGIGAEDLAHSDTTTGLTSDIKYSYSMNGVTLNVTYDTVSDDTGATIGFSAAGFGVTVGFAEDANTSDSISVGKVTYDTGAGLTLAAMVSNYDDSDTNTGDTSGAGIAVSYAVNDAFTIVAVASQNDEGSAAADTDAQGLGFTYNMGGGLTLAGGVGENSANQSVFDLGFNMSF